MKHENGAWNALKFKYIQINFDRFNNLSRSYYECRHFTHPLNGAWNAPWI